MATPFSPSSGGRWGGCGLPREGESLPHSTDLPAAAAPRCPHPPAPLPRPPRSISWHLVLRAGDLASNPSCYLNFYVRVWKGEHAPVLRRAESSGHAARVRSRDSSPPREDAEQLYILPIWPSTAPNAPMQSPGAIPGFPAVAEGSGNAEGHGKRRGAGTPLDVVYCFDIYIGPLAERVTDVPMLPVLHVSSKLLTF